MAKSMRLRRIRRRAELQRRSPSAARDLFDFGPERAAHEAIWSDDVHAAINTALERVAPALRYFVRGQLVEAIRQDGATADAASGRVPVLLAQVRERLAMRNLSSDTLAGVPHAPDGHRACCHRYEPAMTRPDPLFLGCLRFPSLPTVSQSNGVQP